MTNQPTLVYWLWYSTDKAYANAIRDGRQITTERTPSIAALDDALGILKQKRQTIQSDSVNYSSSTALPPDALNAEMQTLPSLDAAIATAEDALWMELTK
jgi:hypothetical protein